MDLSTAQREYYKRPPDERFPSIDAMIANAEDERALCQERAYRLKELTFRPVNTHAPTTDAYRDAAHAAQIPDATIELASPRGAARLTHWAFGQAARMVGAPAGYLRELPAAIACDALNFGLRQAEKDASGKDTSATLLVKAPNGNPKPLIRSITSTQYGRVWDAQLYAAMRDQVIAHGAAGGGNWTLPPTWDGVPAGAYRGDRDSFLIVVNGGSIVNDPSLTNGDGKMFRGLLVRNSEVGAASLLIERILFRFICGNHMLWGAVIDKTYRRRHVGDKTLADTLYEIRKTAREWSEQSTERDNAIIRGLIETEIAHTKDEVIAELRKMGAAEATAKAMYDMAEQTETASPRSFWGAAQGLTRLSQEQTHQDDRLMYDQLAAAIMARGRARVAV